MLMKPVFVINTDSKKMMVKNKMHDHNHKLIITISIIIIVNKKYIKLLFVSDQNVKKVNKSLAKENG